MATSEMIEFDRLNSIWENLPEKMEQMYQIGPFIVSIWFTNSLLANKLTRACAHLRINHTSADLTIRLWSGTQLPELDWNLIQTNGYRGYSAPPFYFHHFEVIGALSAIDTERNIAYYAIRDPDALPWWVYGSPLQVIFHVWLREKGMQLTHSASIGNRKSAILLSGKGGSGKSTTVLSCLEEGLHLLGEDYVILAPYRVYSIYQTAKWLPHTRTLFPYYESHIVNSEKADLEKALIYYGDFFQNQIEKSSSVHAIVSLEIGNSACLQKGDLRTSLQSILLSTAMQLPHPDPRTTKNLQKFLEPLAHYRLILGSNLKENVALLKGLF